MSARCLIAKSHGHACVSVHYSDITIVFDPHDGHSLGLPQPQVKGDIVLSTHSHFDHNAIKIVSKPESIVLESFVGEKRLKIKDYEIIVEGYAVPHDKQSGKRRGWVSAYKVTVEDFIVIHLGDIGDYPSEDVMEKLSTPRPDILFIPVGGFYTIEPYEAWEIASSLNPVYLVPIHYWVKGLNLPIKPLKDFLLQAKTGKEERELLEVCDKKPLDEKMKIIVLT